MKRVFCSFRKQFSYHQARRIQTCVIESAIDSDHFAIGSKSNTSILAFAIYPKSDPSFLPRYIGEKFSHVEELIAHKSSLTIIRSFYFSNMRRLQFIDLSSNQIAVIEKGSFDVLFNMKYLHLGNNRIDILDRDLFKAMINLKNLDLAHNRINSLDPTTFEISDGKLLEVNLLSNVCLNKTYEEVAFDNLEDDIISYCQPD